MRAQPREECGRTTVKNWFGTKVTLARKSGNPGNTGSDAVDGSVMILHPRSGRGLGRVRRRQSGSVSFGVVPNNPVQAVTASAFLAFGQLGKVVEHGKFQGDARGSCLFFLFRHEKRLASKALKKLIRFDP